MVADTHWTQENNRKYFLKYKKEVITEMQNTLEGFNSRLDEAAELINELDGRLNNRTHPDSGKMKEDFLKVEISWGTFETTSSIITFPLWVSQ